MQNLPVRPTGETHHALGRLSRHLPTRRFLLPLVDPNTAPPGGEATRREGLAGHEVPSGREADGKVCCACNVARSRATRGGKGVWGKVRASSRIDGGSKKSVRNSRSLRTAVAHTQLAFDTPLGRCLPQRREGSSPVLWPATSRRDFVPPVAACPK